MMKNLPFPVGKRNFIFCIINNSKKYFLNLNSLCKASTNRSKGKESLTTYKYKYNLSIFPLKVQLIQLNLLTVWIKTSFIEEETSVIVYNKIYTIMNT